jgi:hypothetical protein
MRFVSFVFVCLHICLIDCSSILNKLTRLTNYEADFRYGPASAARGHDWSYGYVKRATGNFSAAALAPTIENFEYLPRFQNFIWRLNDDIDEQYMLPSTSSEYTHPSIASTMQQIDKFGAISIDTVVRYRVESVQTLQGVLASFSFQLLLQGSCSNYVYGDGVLISVYQQFVEYGKLLYYCYYYEFVFF